MEQQRSGIPSYQARGELSFELVQATEAAALACAGLLGKGDPEGVSNAAGEAMRRALDRSDMTGTVVLSPRHNPSLPPGAVIGAGDRKVDLGVYPVEGASQVARGHINAVSLLVAVDAGGFARLPATSQMEKFVAGPGARGDFASAVMAAIAGSGIDAAIGIGDLHATLIAACAVRCLGGEFLARLLPRNDEERALVGDAATRVYGMAELAPAADISVAITGVTGGPLLPGVAFASGYAETCSLVMSSRHATVRRRPPSTT
ncbi:MAG: hypothetical protein AUI15_25035 [Actinobacteria bacterium 13_2_20CM_2_66_6]|nr:MAG: hypothetical protein AUI15_25035 [Actinobacteria bacterium 13_2_20CM_2_66_6]